MPADHPWRVALVHDWLNQDGGAEAVLDVLHDLFPAAPIYTTIADTARVPASAGWDVRTCWLDRLPGIHAHHQPFLPLYPLAWSSIHADGYDVVLTNKSAFCHGVRTEGARHVCYCLTPTRFVWDPDVYLAHERVPPGGRLALRLLLPWLQRWDRTAADRVDAFIAISTVVQERIRRIYGRESVVIHPPVPVGECPPPTAEVDDYYLVLARLVPYKRIDLAIEAFNRLGRCLVIVGDGRDRARLAGLAGPTVTFAGRLPRDQVVRLLARCRALVWPGVEDFGLAPVEAMGAGRPVIARRGGGVLDTVVEGVTGIFFDGESPAALAEAVVRADTIAWHPAAIRRQAARFDRAVFEQRLLAFLADVVGER